MGKWLVYSIALTIKYKLNLSTDELGDNWFVDLLRSWHMDL